MYLSLELGSYWINIVISCYSRLISVSYQKWKWNTEYIFDKYWLHLTGVKIIRSNSGSDLIQNENHLQVTIVIWENLRNMFFFYLFLHYTEEMAAWLSVCECVSVCANSCSGLTMLLSGRWLLLSSSSWTSGEGLGAGGDVMSSGSEPGLPIQLMEFPAWTHTHHFVSVCLCVWTASLLRGGHPVGVNLHIYLAALLLELSAAWWITRLYGKCIDASIHTFSVWTYELSPYRQLYWQPLWLNDTRRALTCGCSPLVPFVLELHPPARSCQTWESKFSLEVFIHPSIFNVHFLPFLGCPGVFWSLSQLSLGEGSVTPWTSGHFIRGTQPFTLTQINIQLQLI